MCRALMDCSEAFKRGWKAAVKERRIVKNAFFAMAGDKTGQGLIILMQRELFEKLAMEQECTMEGNKEWLKTDEIVISGGTDLNYFCKSYRAQGAGPIHLAGPRGWRTCLTKTRVD